VPGNISRTRIAANELPEKRVLAQRHRFPVQQLLERAHYRFALRDFLRDAVIGELLLDARREADRYRHDGIVIHFIEVVIQQQVRIVQ